MAGDVSTTADTAILGRILGALTATWRALGWSLLVLAIVLAGLTLLLLVGVRSTISGSARIQFTFPGAMTGTYPNNTTFSLTQLTQPEVLEEVYQQSRLAEAGISYAEFASSVSVTPYYIGGFDAAERYRVQLADRRLSFVERKELEERFAKELAEKSQTAAEIRVAVRKRIFADTLVLVRAANNIAETWAEQAIVRRNVLRRPGGIASDIVVEKSAPGEVSLALSGLLRGTSRLVVRLGDLALVPGIDSILDPQLKVSRTDLVRRVDDLRIATFYTLSSAIESDAAQARDRFADFLKKLADLEANAGRLEAQAAVVERVIEGIAEKALRALPAAGSTGGASPQLSEGFLDRLIELANVGGYRQYLQTLTQERLELLKQASEARSRREELLGQTVVEGIRAFEASQASPETLKSVYAAIDRLTDQVNVYWATLNRLYTEADKLRFGEARRLYVSVQSVSDTSISHPVLSARYALLMILVWLLAGVGAWLIAALRYFLTAPASVPETAAESPVPGLREVS